MCGIVGFVDQRNTSSQEILHRMSDTQTHRGPNAEGYFFDTLENRQIGLGHKRLSIIDISDQANQPMKFEHLIIIYNGEIYNFAEIKNELSQAGYSFQTKSDTEVVLKAFHKWGIESVNKFRGMFSFCIFDQQNKKIYLIRDRVGVKPLYFYYSDKVFLFSSETKAFHFHPQFKKALCPNGLNLYFQYGYVSSSATIFEDTKKVSPGHYVEYDIIHHSWNEKNYWNLSSYYLLPKLSINENDAIDQLEKLLIDSFSLRMIADVPVGVFLSGGIDSSLVASILQANSSKPIETFTMGFDNKNFDESTHARKIAKHLGTHHHEQLCTWKDAEAILFELPQMYDEPFADSSAIPTALVSKLTRQKVVVALSGDGGDELFCGYSSYWLNAKRFNQINKLPFSKLLGKILNFIPDPIMGFYRSHYDLYNRYLKLKSILSHTHVEEKYHSITQTFTFSDINKLIPNNKFLHTPKKIFPHLNTMERMMLIDFNHYLPDDLMVKVDRASMYYSLEGREPFLDHKIMEFAAQLPIELKLKKYILKKILAKYIPISYFERKKQGFGIPVNLWLKKEMHFLLDRYLDPHKIKKQGIFNHKYITALHRSFVRSKTNDPRIWTLLIFQIWYEKYFNENF